MGGYRVLAEVRSMGNGGGENGGKYGSWAEAILIVRLDDITRQIAFCGKRIDGLDLTPEMIHEEAHQPATLSPASKHWCSNRGA